MVRRKMRRASTGYSRDASTNKDSEVSMKVDEPVQGPSMKSLIQYFENAGSVSVESTPGMPWTFVTTDSRRFSRGSALMRATMSESPVVPMISWISGTFFNALMVFCVSVDRMRRYASSVAYLRMIEREPSRKRLASQPKRCSDHSEIPRDPMFWPLRCVGAWYSQKGNPQSSQRFGGPAHVFAS